MPTRELVVPADMKHLVERFNYAPGLKVGNMLYLAGQVGRDSDMNVITSSFEDHVVMAWENVGKILREGGTDFEHIVEIITFHVGLQEHLMEFIEIKGRYVKPQPVPPTWTAIGVSELTFPGQIVEIKVTAVIPD